MPAHKAPALQLSTCQERELTDLVRARSTPQALVQRARIVLLAGDGAIMHFANTQPIVGT